ncbi:hypothetical protein NFJ02_40g106710 [Pycnococcus provasolii]
MVQEESTQRWTGGATAALAINVSLPRIMRWGIWKSLTAVECYLDPLAPADSASFHFFGHLLHQSSARPLPPAAPAQTG